MNEARRVVDDAEWAALRAAAPGFGPVWEAHRASEFYVAVESYNSVWALTRFVEERLRMGDEGPLLALADAFEGVYAPADDDLEELPRIGVLEAFIEIAERNGVDPARIFRRVGAAGREGWVIAWRYVNIDGPARDPGEG
jgi:hypothetical protein